MDGYKIFSIVVGLVYMAVLGVTESFRETGKDLFLDLLIALLFGGAWFFGKKFFKMEDDAGGKGDYPRFCVKFQQVQNEAFEIWVRCWFLAPGLFNYTQ